MNVSHIKVTQAGLIALVTTIIGQLVAFVPAFAPDKQILISAASAGISAAFLIANAVHHLASSNVSADEIRRNAIQAAQSELGRIDFNQLVANAVDGKLPDVPGLVRGEITKVLSQYFGSTQPPVVPAPASAVTSSTRPGG